MPSKRRVARGADEAKGDAAGGVISDPALGSGRPRRVSASAALASFDWTDDVIVEVASDLTDDPVRQYADSIPGTTLNEVAGTTKRSGRRDATPKGASVVKTKASVAWSLRPTQAIARRDTKQFPVSERLLPLGSSRDANPGRGHAVRGRLGRLGMGRGFRNAIKRRSSVEEDRGSCWEFNELMRDWYQNSEDGRAVASHHPRLPLWFFHEIPDKLPPPFAPAAEDERNVETPKSGGGDGRSGDEWALGSPALGLCCDTAFSAENDDLIQSDNDCSSARQYEGPGVDGVNPADGTGPRWAGGAESSHPVNVRGSPGAKHVWRSCAITGRNMKSDEVVVAWEGGFGEATLHPHEVFVEKPDGGGGSRDRLAFVARVQKALSRRRACEALLAYRHYVKSMPVDATVTGTLQEGPSSRIMSLVLCAFTGAESEDKGRVMAVASDLMAVANDLMAEVTRDYELCMSALVFDSNMMNEANIKTYVKLKLPPPSPPKPAPERAVVSTPPHDFQGVSKTFRRSTFVTSPAAVKASLAVRAECHWLVDVRALSTFHKEPLRLESFSRCQDEALSRAKRVIRDDWPQRVGSSVIKALRRQHAGAKPASTAVGIVSEQGTPSPRGGGGVAASGCQVRNVSSSGGDDRPRFDRFISIMEEYEESEIRPFLQWANYNMTDALQGVTKWTLEEFSDYLLRCCSCQVEVRHTNEVIVTDREGKREHRRGAMPPLFKVEIVRSTFQHLLNFSAVEEAKERIKEWKASPEAREAEGAVVCPIAEVLEVRGWVPEADTALNEFRLEVLKCYDGTLEGVADIHQIQRYVMDRLFWPEPQFIAVAGPREPWVMSLRQRVEEALDGAIVPLKEYVRLFEKYIDFLNLNVEQYMSLMTPVVPPADGEGDEDEGLGVATVDLAGLRAVLVKHRAAEAEIRADIPNFPVDCGLFSVNPSGLGNLLTMKHRNIAQQLLKEHEAHCKAMASACGDKFQSILSWLQRKPRNIEEVAQLEEYMKTLDTTLAPLSAALETIMDCNELLEEFGHSVSVEHSSDKWVTFAWPQRIAQQCEDTAALLRKSRGFFLEEMESEQECFTHAMDLLELEVAGLEQHEDLVLVDRVAKLVGEISGRIGDAENKSRLFQSREGLFGRVPTEYDQILRVRKALEPYANLWSTADEWLESYEAWTKGSFLAIDADTLEADVERFGTAISKASRVFENSGKVCQSNICNVIKDKIAAFRPKVPAIVALRNPGMKPRHWEQLSEKLGYTLNPDETYTLEDLLELDLEPFQEQIDKVSESAGKEYQIEKALMKMESEWTDSHLEIIGYRETGSGILKRVDEINAVLDEQMTMTQAMQFSAFKGPFAERIDTWNEKLYVVSEVLDAWLTVQRNWLYLQPIFESPDINKQLPTEGKKFAAVDKNWRQTISSAKSNSKVIEFCNSFKLLERFKESALLLDEVQKGLSDYLETKRSAFARLYFLSNDELLSILSESKDVHRVQPHLKKCFEGIDKVVFDRDLLITHMVSPEGEQLELVEKINPKGQNVEAWLLELEGKMRVSVRDHMYRAIQDYLCTGRCEWMQKWPGMCVLNASQLHWTAETEQLLAEKGEEAPAAMLERQLAQLDDMVILVRGKLSNNARTTVGALTVIDVHARDVMMKLAYEKVADRSDFSWTSQLRYYWSDDELWAEMVAARRPYGYEYLGNSFRLVITPLTDKCYLTLMGALQMVLGGAPAGPAGTGKTETTKDLSKALAMQCVVFNCSDGLDYIAMGKFFKGLASCGAWACFDEFNRINIEVLSVVGQQVMTIQQALKADSPRISFEGSQIIVRPGFGVFITMNPGYAGRSDLPDSLKALFRPVAMMVPDYALIGEIMFFAYGFAQAKECGAKMVTTFKLCSEQLSAQPHYDYGMRAVKTVITAAGNLKRAEPDGDEMVLLLRALQDVNFPKFLEMDLPLFEGIISDLFPGRKRPALDYGTLNSVMKLVIEARGLQPHPFFTTKVIQLYEMIVVRHGLMLVGPTGGGKSSNLHVLEETLTRLKRMGQEGFGYEKVIIYQLNPKSITMGQMYGEFDPNTHEWQDGIMSTMYRLAASSPTSDRKWVMFDGPVDAIWIENMNTVLDDNKKLCLNSGEIIKMSPEMTMMFEVEDLAVASPATVSRVGIIYMEPRGLGLDALCQSWLTLLPSALPQDITIQFCALFDTYLSPGLAWMRQWCREVVPTVDNNLAQSLMRVLDCFLEPFQEADGKPPPDPKACKALVMYVEALFLFAFVWSIGCTVDEPGRKQFDYWIRTETASNASPWIFPIEGTVYDYVFSVEKGDKGQWVPWMSTTEKYVVDPKLQFNEIIVPTTDGVRNTYLLDLLIRSGKHVLTCGPTGTGKTVNIAQYLMGQSSVGGRCVDSSVSPFTITFSAQTSANMTQDMMDAKVEKRRKGVFGPPARRQFVVHVDDLNMPKKEEYGAQPPIEILRQWFDQEGWYDRKELTFRKIIDVTMVCSMGPPGGGRAHVTARFVRHFNVIGYVDMSDDDKRLIFRTILDNFLSTGFEDGLLRLSSTVVDATIDVFNTITRELLPTPQKSHYIFNLRDMAKVFQGMLMSSYKSVTAPEELVRLWCHESKRVFEDRLINDEDHVWFKQLLQRMVSNRFSMEWVDVVPQERLIYGDYMMPGAELTVYEEISNLEKLTSTINQYLADHNAESKQPMPLVMFLDAIEHVSRVSRTLRQPQGNALLLGMGGSGRQSMTKLATYIAGYNLFQVEISKGYSVSDWRDDVRRCLLSAGLKNKPTTFLFSDVQIVNEVMLEDINNILNAGDVPNLYAQEDIDSIMNACRVDCQRKRIPPTKVNIFAQYVNRVRSNIHLVICMSPIGSAFRDRLRMFPSLVNCCTIDWFTEWPAEALKGVATAMMTETDLELGNALEGIVEMFRVVHQSVETIGKEFYEYLRRRVWVTPMSYLELLGSFKRQLAKKRAEVGRNRSRLQVGLDKLSSTKDVVATLQEELKVLQPQLVVTMKEVEDMMVQINADKEEAEVVRVKVEAEEASANEKAAATKAIADDAQRDLDLALPALESAVACLNSLKKSDIDEVKSLKTPPKGVKLTMEVCCLMFDVKPVKVKDHDSGKKVDDFWEPAKKQLLADAKGFMDSLIKFDKDNIPDRIIKKVEPFQSNPDFTPEQIEKASKACTAICMWAIAMYQYHFVALGVAPKRAALAEAQKELDVVMAQLNDAKARLAGVQARLAELQKGFDDAVCNKQELEDKAERCVVQLANAEKLIGGLGGEEKRWTDTVAKLTLAMDKLPGDIMIASGTLSYLGPFTVEYRTRIADSWVQALVDKGLDHTEGTDMEGTLADPVKIRQWQMCGLPPDSLSSQNGIIMDTARRWPLLIDPQGQANRFVKNMGKDPALCPNGMDVTKLTHKKVLQTLENGVRFGKWVLLENVVEELDAALEPILLQQKFKQGGQDMIRLGDNTVPYNEQFRLIMITKLPNPEYAPEVQVKVSLLNFTITIKGLEEQLLNTAVKEELPDLAQKKEELVINGAAMNIQLYGIESQILKLLSESEGNILDNTELIETLAEAKVKSSEIKEKMCEAEETEKEIEARSEEYRPVAKRASLLYFCLADLAVIDPMYQYALPWFSGLFCKSIGQTPPAPDLEGRLQNLNDCFTAAVYVNVCRSLFETHKLLFSFLLAIKILQGDNRVDAAEWRFLISGMSPGRSQMDNPDPAWIEANVWGEIRALCGLDFFAEFAASFAKQTAAWRRVFDSNEPHKVTFPVPAGKLPRKAGSAIFGVGSYPDKDVEGWLRRMSILRCLRRDKMTEAMQAFVVDVMGPFFVEPPTFNLKACYEDSSVTMPLIFVLSTGSDPNKDLFQLAEDMEMTDKMRSIALGQGQGTIAAAMIEKGAREGNWVLLQNCHLSISWMPELERLCDEINPTQTHQDFRLWLTSMPSKFFPTAVLQIGVKMTKEPPKGLRANLKATYSKMDDDKLKRTCKPADFRKILFGLCFFHALVVERKKFGPLGWNVPYEFNETDLDICIAQLEMYVDEYAVIPYQVLRQLTSVVNYGGRITDDKDMRTSNIIIAGFYSPEILSEGFAFSRSGRYASFEPDPDNLTQSYLDYVETFPLNAEPEVFGMHDNASITYAIAETEMIFSIVLSMQPRTGGGGGVSREDLIVDIAKGMEERLPATFDVEAAGMAYPTSYHESMNTVLVQELQRYNNLIALMRRTLKEVQRALKGLVVLSAELEAMGNSMFDQAVPVVWQSKAYPSLKPLGPWFQDLLNRLGFMSGWVSDGIPPVFWISGFFFPQGFLTAGQQNFARKHDVPIDSTSFSFHFKDELHTALRSPKDGVFIYGLFLEGARWDKKIQTLVDPRPKELFSAMPVVHLLPEQDRETPQTGIYRCPVYKILTRTGVLSTTGHSTNFVFWIEIPSNKPNTFRSSLVSETNKQVQYCDQDYWIRAGVACFCALRY